MNLADAKRLSIGTAIYVIPKHEIETIFEIRKIFVSTYEFDGIEKKKENYENPDRCLGKIRLRSTEANSFRLMGWYNAQNIEANRNIAIARWERMIHQLYLAKGCNYDEKYLSRFRQYGSAREALYAESVRYRLETMGSKDIYR